MKKTAIAILSFNRPLYLQQVLNSLKNQNYDLNLFDVYLFQDHCCYKDIKLTEPCLIIDCILLFEKYFPKENLFIANNNLGVAMNFDRAEKLLFNSLGYEKVIFLEDDMILGPNYISTLLLMNKKFGSDDRVGMIAAYGVYHQNSLEEQEKNKAKIVPMHHNWGFLLTKPNWLKRQPFVEEYLEKFIKEKLYIQRDNEQIFKWLREKGCGVCVSSQDWIKAYSTILNKQIRISCFPNFGKYIGEIGVHNTPALFKECSWDHQNLYNGEVTEFEDLTDNLYNKIFSISKENFF